MNHPATVDSNTNIDNADLADDYFDPADDYPDLADDYSDIHHNSVPELSSKQRELNRCCNIIKTILTHDSGDVRL